MFIFVVISLMLAVCNASPIWIDESALLPGYIFRIGRAPAFGFGNSFSRTVGDVTQASSAGATYQNLAYSAPATRTIQYVPVERLVYPVTYQTVPVARTSSSAASSAQSYGLGQAVSSAQTRNGLQSESALTAIQHGGFQSAASSAQNVRSLGYDGFAFDTSVANARSASDFGSSVSAAETNNGLGYSSAVSSVQNVGGFDGAAAEVVQQRFGGLQRNTAASINGLGVQSARAQSINTGFY